MVIGYSQNLLGYNCQNGTKNRTNYSKQKKHTRSTRTCLLNSSNEISSAGTYKITVSAAYNYQCDTDQYAEGRARLEPQPNEMLQLKLTLSNKQAMNARIEMDDVILDLPKFSKITDNIEIECNK